MQSLSELTKVRNVNDILRLFDLENNHENLEEQEDNPFDYFLQLTVWATIRSTYHTTLQATSSQLVFGRDMIHNIAFRAEQTGIECKKENSILSISPIKKKRRITVKFLMNIRLETKCQ
jgi:hypothetical protein